MAKKNKPSKIKVVIDKPSVLPPGRYHADIIESKVYGNEIVILIKVNKDVKQLQ